MRAGGVFSENRDSQPLSVSGSQSTLNNLNTSGAAKLHKSESAATRDDPNQQERYPEALGGQGAYPGHHIGTGGYVGGSNKAKHDLGLQGHEYHTHGATEACGTDGYRSQYNGGIAPSYINSVVENAGSTNVKDPRGNNLREGGFDSNPNNNASFTSDIGSNKDPGRKAESQYQRKMAESGVEARAIQQRVEKCAQPYNPLEREESA